MLFITEEEEEEEERERERDYFNPFQYFLRCSTLYLSIQTRNFCRTAM
jgi:hypothetical protein